MRPTYDDIRRMVERARAGDHLARHSLIEAHIGLAVNVVKNYDDDAVLANVLCKLVEAVGAFLATGKNVSALPAFLKQTLTNEAVDFIRENKRHAARILKYPTRESYTRDDCYEMMDEIVACCETPMEEQMVHLRAGGLTLAEVAKKMDTSPSVIHGAMKRLELRYGVKRKVTA